MSDFYSNGKLLLTGEYLVLDGAEALALPTVFGQYLTVTETDTPTLLWQSYTFDKRCWLEAEFQLPDLKILKSGSAVQDETVTLQKLLRKAQVLNPDFLATDQGYSVKTTLTFPQNWGLGSSSTLVNNIAQWAKIDAFSLQFSVFGGSGYDIACAQHNAPIRYQLKNSNPVVHEVSFDPSFKEQLYFVYLNRKQNSRDSITSYKKQAENVDSYIDTISQLTRQIINCQNLADFEKLLSEHEGILSGLLHSPPVQEQLFSDYFGRTKSLGAWGGDFILATGNPDTPGYFKKKGFNTVIPYSEMIL
ncbi:MAG: GHMP kinase [Flavobacteriaceae bacterium]|nr:GHMP kinase [Flavobacteriaceae bacterium]